MDERLCFDCILLVEDDSITNFLNTLIIQKLQITKTIVVKENGLEALEYLRENPCPDLILLDLNMPIMNGFEFLEVFQKEEFLNKQKTKVVILSSSENPHDKVIIDSYGLFVLHKPLTQEKMLNTVDAIIKIRL
jgi:CheY-like chemotaxis protein